MPKTLNHQSDKQSTFPESALGIRPDYSSVAIAESTMRAYAASLKHFTDNGYKLPATPEDVVLYLTTFAGKLKVGTLRHRVISVHRAHVEAGFSSPTQARIVKQTMQGIRRTFGSAQRRVHAVVKDDLLEMLIMVEKQYKPLQAARNKAILLMGFATACRRSELVALRVEDLTFYDAGCEVYIRRSKTDQEGAGDTVFVPFAKGARCPVLAIRDWLALANIAAGWIFRPISRHDKLVGQKALTPQTIALVVKAAVASVRGDEAAKQFSGHSMRAGYATQAAMSGHTTHQIKLVTRHKSDVVLAGYIRPVSKRATPSLL